MLDTHSDDLDMLIDEQKKRVAEQFFGEAWEKSIEEGIEPYLLAEAALQTALVCLSKACGDDSVQGLVDDLALRHECGHFRHGRVLQ